MLIWDDRWTGHEKRIERLSYWEQLNFALACADDSRSIIGAKRIDEIFHGFFGDNYGIIDCLWESCERSMVVHPEKLIVYCERMDEKIEKLCDDIGDIEGGLGIVYLTLADGLKDSKPFQDVLELISSCYETAMNVEILEKLDRCILESELRSLECANEVCMKAIDKQFEFLEKIEFGQIIKRKR